MPVVMFGFRVIWRVFSTRLNHWQRADISIHVKAAAAVKYRKPRVRIGGNNVVDDCAQTGVIGNHNNYY